VGSGSSDLDLLDLVAASAQGIRDGVDGLYAVKLGLVLAIGETKVVGKCDLHSVDAARMGSLSTGDDLNKKQRHSSTDKSVICDGKGSPFKVFAGA
jgi:hypothetical protein